MTQYFTDDKRQPPNKGVARCLSLLIACLAVLPAHGQDEMPFTRLFDTGIASAQPLADDTLPKRAGWTLVPEDKVDHQFSGDAVLLNDKLVVVLRKQGRGAEIYAKAANRLKHRASVGHVGAGSTGADSIGALKVVENNSSAVIVQTTAKDEASAALSLRLTTGEAILEIRPNEGAKSVEVLTKTRYVVVPDYFGDDVVFETGAPSPTLRAPSPPVGTSDGTRERRYLPAENFLLDLLEGGDAIMMSVWQSREQDVSLAGARPGRETGLSSTAIQCLKGKSVWLAFLEYPGLWHASDASAKEAWLPPFAAKWRCSLVRGTGVADSWTTEKPVGSGPEGSAGVGPLPPDQTTMRRAEVRAPNAPLLVYPIDRSAATPLTVTCATDVMRNTLGVGPCQYILACEGMAAQGDPTPNAVMNWVEKQFEQKKQRKAADDIKERLQVMTEHVAQARTRIQSYGEFAGQIRRLLANKPGAEPFRQIVDDLDRAVAIGLVQTASPERVKQLAGEVSGLVGQENASGACQRLGEQLRSLGAVQDSTLAKSRMAVRRLRAQAKTEAANKSSASDLALEVERLAEQQLQRK